MTPEEEKLLTEELHLRKRTLQTLRDRLSFEEQAVKEIEQQLGIAAPEPLPEASTRL